MDKMAITPKGLRMLLAGLIVMVSGYILMTGGGILMGIVIEIVAIMGKFK